MVQIFKYELNESVEKMFYEAYRLEITVIYFYIKVQMKEIHIVT